MARTSISADMLNHGLKQLGASKINMTSSKISVVKFDINENLRVSYFCHVKDEEKIYLQRIEPYPVRNYRFETVDNIISFIKTDVEQFRNASHSSNFQLFLDIIDRNYAVRRELEALFLLNNVDHSLLENILENETKTFEMIANAEHHVLKNDPGQYPGEEEPLENIFEIDQDLASSSEAVQLYGEKEEKQLGPIAQMISDSIKEAVLELKEDIKKDIKADILRELRK